MNGHEMIKEPGMFKRWNALCFQPHAFHVLVGRALRCSFDTKAESHFLQPLELVSVKDEQLREVEENETQLWYQNCTAKHDLRGHETRVVGSREHSIS